ncbi:MAG: zinc ribbon domain-containing protein [Burkholderiales bacterium]|nr:zinc ribbon domain-containing protein [Phycisphaerae bacterium]
MPMYEYTCRKCGHGFEKLVKTMSGADRVSCPECQSKKTERQFSVFAVGADGGKSSSVPQRGCGRCSEPGGCGMN